MDIDPDETNGLDAGANDNSEDDNYGVTPARKRRKRPSQSTEVEDEVRDDATPSNLHPADPGNFLKLSSAIKILVSDTITEPELQSADKLSRDYCQELIAVSFARSPCLRPFMYINSFMVPKSFDPSIIMLLTRRAVCGIMACCVGSGRSYSNV